MFSLLNDLRTPQLIFPPGLRFDLSNSDCHKFCRDAKLGFVTKPKQLWQQAEGVTSEQVRHAAAAIAVAAVAAAVTLAAAATAAAAAGTVVAAAVAAEEEAVAAATPAAATAAPAAAVAAAAAAFTNYSNFLS